MFEFESKGGIEELKKNNLITTNLLVGLMQRLRGSSENIRKNTGTKLGNPTNNQIVYTPPEGENLIRDKLSKLEIFINDSEFSDLDPLIKMALIHYQFEAIHPFSDGNGRTGRILNVLYLIQQELLGLPVLYLSHYIIQNKSTDKKDKTIYIICYNEKNSISIRWWRIYWRPFSKTIKRMGTFSTIKNWNGENL